MINRPAILITLFLFGCSSESSLETRLLDLINTNDSHSHHNACIFLSELSFSERLLSDVKNRAPESICKHYLIAKKSNDKLAIDTFIKNFPMGQDLEHIWSIHRKSGYPIEFTPPYLTYLTKLAASSDLALDKLINVLNQTKAADSENITDSLAALYNKQENRITNALSKNNASINLTTFIKETAEHLKRTNNE